MVVFLENGHGNDSFGRETSAYHSAFGIRFRGWLSEGSQSLPAFGGDTLFVM